MQNVHLAEGACSFAAGMLGFQGVTVMQDYDDGEGRTQRPIMEGFDADGENNDGGDADCDALAEPTDAAEPAPGTPPAHRGIGMTLLRGIGSVLGVLLGGILGLCGLTIAFMAVLLPFMINTTNGTHDDDPMMFLIPIELAYLIAGAAYIAYRICVGRLVDRRRTTPRKPVPTHTRDGVRRPRGAMARWLDARKQGSPLLTLIAIVAIGYGLIWGGSDIIAVINGPVSVSVARPRIEQRTEKNTEEYDEGTHQECTIVFDANGKQIRFDSGECPGGELDPGDRIGRALDRTPGKRVLLLYYQTIHGPVFHSIRSDPQYS